MVNIRCSNPSLTDFTFSGNSAEEGGGMYGGSYSSPTLPHCAPWGSTAPEGAQMHNDSSAPTVSHSLVQGGCPSGATCNRIVGADPHFVDIPDVPNTGVGL